MNHDHDQASESHAPASTDLLSSVLATVRLQAAVFFQWEPSWPYATGVPNANLFRPILLPRSQQLFSYHIVLQGPCWATVENHQPIELSSGDILLLPHGDAYNIASQPTAPSPADAAPAREFFQLMSAGKLPPVIQDGGPGPQMNRLLCGFLGCDLQPFNPVISELPALVHISPPGAEQDSLTSLINMALQEAARAEQGAQLVLLRLAELMCIEVMRRYLTSANAKGPWALALKDPLIGRVLSLIHQRYHYPWTLQLLADEVGASRALLAERFKQLVKMPPMHYLTCWRMQQAAQQLRDTNLKNFAVAQAVGYESEAAFSRAFKRVVGVSPSCWREGGEQYE